jgi:hypothetical protein
MIHNVHKMGHCWLHCKWSETLAQLSSKHYNTGCIHHCIYYTQKYKMTLQICPQWTLSRHFTVYLVTNTFTDANGTRMWSCMPPHNTCNLVVWLKLVECLLYYHTINEFPKRDSSALILTTMTHSTQNSWYFSENYETSLQQYYHWHLPCDYTLCFLLATYT